MMTWVRRLMVMVSAAVMAAGLIWSRGRAAGKKQTQTDILREDMTHARDIEHRADVVRSAGPVVDPVGVLRKARRLRD